MKFKIGATIPTAQYANLMPEIEVEAETLEEAQELALPQIQKIWNSVCETGKELTIRDVKKQMESAVAMTTTVNGNSAPVTLYLDDNHVYRDEDGNEYQSGSKYAKQFGYGFDKASILPMYASKVKESPERIDSFWTDKGDCSTTFGHALHKALETYGKHHELALKLDRPIGIHPLLMGPVEEFFDTRQVDENAKYEVFVADKEGKRCGQIDRLVITGNGKCIIEDFKTNQNLTKQGSPAKLKAPFDSLPNQPLSEYKLQLNFYREILEKLGYTVEGMRIHHYGENGWEVIEVENIPLT